MRETREQRWMKNYDALLAYVEEYHHLPDKKKKVNSKLVNWWKYNKRMARLGKLSDERRENLRKLNDMREEAVYKW